MTVQVVTPDAQIVAADDATFVLAHGIAGDVGIMPNHAPLLIALGVGPVRVDRGDQKEYMVVDGGFLQVSRNQVIILAEYAITPDQITRSQNEADLRDAEAALARDVNDIVAIEKVNRAKAIDAMLDILKM
ncbi:MAG: ATP synthase F1 subunit epsilon [Actinomycetota bacterium]